MVITAGPPRLHSGHHVSGGFGVQQPQGGGMEGGGVPRWSSQRDHRGFTRDTTSLGALGPPHHLPVLTGVWSLGCPPPGDLCLAGSLGHRAGPPDGAFTPAAGAWLALGGLGRDSES